MCSGTCESAAGARTRAIRDIRIDASGHKRQGRRVICAPRGCGSRSRAARPRRCTPARHISARGRQACQTFRSAARARATARAMGGTSAEEGGASGRTSESSSCRCCRPGQAAWPATPGICGFMARCARLRCVLCVLSSRRAPSPGRRFARARSEQAAPRPLDLETRKRRRSGGGALCSRRLGSCPCGTRGPCKLAGALWMAR
jgi:hypothetical protein